MVYNEGMNRNVCKICRRFEPDTNNIPDCWTCAETVWLEESEVIPGHSIIRRDSFHYLNSECEAPVWCERPLEQTILSPEDEVEITPDAGLVFDGNKMADRKLEFKKNSYWTGFPATLGLVRLVNRK